MKKTEIIYLVFSSISNLFLQFGSMIIVAVLLNLFHESTQFISSIIGVLTLIIGIGIANYSGSLVHNYINSDADKKRIGQKGNNIATVLLVTIVPFLIFPFLDYLEMNLTSLMLYSASISSLLIGVVLTFLLTFVKVEQNLN